MKSVLRRILSNLGSIVLAVLLAVAVWIAATLQADPFTPQQYTNLAVVPVNQPPNTLLYQGDETSVSVTVRAAQSVLDSLEPQDLRATVDLSNVEVGVEATVPISITVADPGVRIVSLNPEAQTLRLEALGSLSPCRCRSTCWARCPSATRCPTWQSSHPASRCTDPFRRCSRWSRSRAASTSPGPGGHLAEGERRAQGRVR
jgi:hypothetical protein